MHPPAPSTARPARVLPAHPTPSFVATVAPGACQSFAHVAGEVKGPKLTHTDLNAFAWYTPGGGWNLRNHRKLRRRGLSGAGDTDGSERR